jgi:hypothetical protein
VLAAHGSSELTACTLDRLTRAVDAGEIRAEDLLRTLVGMRYTHDKPNWQAHVFRLIDVFIDGLRRQPHTKPG